MREEAGSTAFAGEDGRRHSRDDWKSLMQNASMKLRGEEPDFSEEGWARRQPKKQ